MDEEYDKVLEKIKEVDADLKAYLREQCKHFGCNVSVIKLFLIIQVFQLMVFFF